MRTAAGGRAAHRALVPRIPEGSANPTRRRDISLAGVRFASITAANRVCSSRSDGKAGFQIPLRRRGFTLQDGEFR